LYYFSVGYNYIASKYSTSLEYLEALTARINKALLGESDEWIIGEQYCMRVADVAPSLRALCEGYTYVPEAGKFFECGVRAGENTAEKKFMYIGGEYKMNATTHDMTDWINGQRWVGKAAPSAKQIAMAWLIKTNQLGLMMTGGWKMSECLFVDELGDDHIIKMET
jgi:hypothetical protein